MTSHRWPTPRRLFFCALACAAGAASLRCFIIKRASIAEPSHLHQASVKTPATNSAEVARLDPSAQTAEERSILAALQQALGEKNDDVRHRMLADALREWGELAPTAAAEWIESHLADSEDRLPAIAALFEGAVRDPDRAQQLVEQLVRTIPGKVQAYGDALIAALAQKGNFSRAAGFAVTTESAFRTEWLSAAYGGWTCRDSAHAAASAIEITDPTVRTNAVDAVITHWTQNDAKALAEFALQALPPGEQRTHALAQSLVHWATEDPVGAIKWINALPPTGELDAGQAAVATQPEVMKRPTLAIDLAQTIVDPTLRSKTLIAIIETWSLSDSKSALHFLATCSDIADGDRADFSSR